MITLATAAQMRELDRAAIQDKHIPSLQLMERAAAGVVSAVQRRIPLEKPPADRPAPAYTISPLALKEYSRESTLSGQMQAILDERQRDPTPRVAVFCGPGNNGGDGFAIARLLLQAGYVVHTFLVGDRSRQTPDAAEMAARLEAAGGSITVWHVDRQAPTPADFLLTAWLDTADCIVDAIFGIGLTREVQGDFLSAIQMINLAPCPVIACDIPSGIHTDSGAVLGDAVEAEETVTFSLPKPGLYLGEGGACSGTVTVADIGIPAKLIRKLEDQQHIRLWTGALTLPRRPRTAHKGTFGRLLLLAGSRGYTGAPALAAEAAVRCGAGLVHLAVPEDIYPVLAAKCTEAMPFPMPERYEDLLDLASKCDAVLAGPGLGYSPAGMDAVLRFIHDVQAPLVLDADGINALTRHNPDPDMHMHGLKLRSAPTVLTPHDGEFARLTGQPLPLENRLEQARAFAQENRCILVLKGHCTVIAGPDGEVLLCRSGNPGMAKGGSGDVLAGMITALLGQKILLDRFGPLQLTAAAVFWHGAAGDLAAADLGEYSMTPSDLLQRIPAVLKAHTEGSF